MFGVICLFGLYATDVCCVSFFYFVLFIWFVHGSVPCMLPRAADGIPYKGFTRRYTLRGSSS